MKKILLAGLLTVAVMGCKNDNLSDQGPLNAFEARYSQSTEVPATNNLLRLKLTELNDSRCPKNVVCIQMGWVDLVFEVTDGVNTIKLPVVFYGSKTKDKETRFGLGANTYGLTLHEILPYPETGNKPKLDAYKISLSVKKL